MATRNDLAARLTSLTRDLILIRSTDSRPEEREHCFQVISNHLDRLAQMRVRRYESNGYTSIVAAPESVESPEVLLCAHLDVIEHPDLASYASTIEDGRICGPGAGDMKGALAILLELFRELHTRHPGLSLGLAVTSDEECGGEHGFPYLFRDLGLRCGQAIMPDGGSLTSLTVEEKGILHVRVQCHGQAAHAARPWQGVNALQRLIDRLVKLTIHFDEYATSEADESGEFWYPTCSITILQSHNETINRIPDRAEAGLDVRFPLPYDAQGMLKEIRQVLGSDCKVEVLVESPPTHLAPDDLYCQVIHEVTGTPARKVRASGGSDARFLTDHDIQVNMSRPLVGNIHAENEWIDIASMVTYYKICEEYILRKLAH
jgi:succinyl-diaminopimelate desuccinylase